MNKDLLALMVEIMEANAHHEGCFSFGWKWNKKTGWYYVDLGYALAG